MNGNINVLNEIKNFIEENNIHVNNGEILQHDLFLYFKKNFTFVSRLIDNEHRHPISYECAMLTNKGKKFFFNRTTLPKNAFEFSIYRGGIKLFDNDSITKFISQYNYQNNVFIRLNISEIETLQLFELIAESNDKFLDSHKDCNLVAIWRRLSDVDCLPIVMNKESRTEMFKILDKMNEKKQVDNVEPITESTVINVVTEPKITLGNKIVEDVKYIDITNEIMAKQYECECEYYQAKANKKNLKLEVVRLIECNPIIH